DNTVPFIARYRKEITGGLNEIELREIGDLLKLYRNLEERKQDVIRIIEEQGQLTPELKEEILAAPNITKVEDLYLPYRPKRKTRASLARDKGLEPLAQFIFEGMGSLEEELGKYIGELVATGEEALQGALDILAEDISDHAGIRGYTRDYMRRTATIVCQAKDEEAKSPYTMYYDYNERVSKIPPHRILAINRAEKEDFIKVDIKSETDPIIKKIEQLFLKGGSNFFGHFNQVAHDAYKRLIEPSVQRDIRNELTEKAEAQAVYVFADNLRNLLLQPPVGGHIVLGLDPAFRTGCKWAVIDEIGKMLEVGVVYPTPPQSKVKEAKEELERVIRKYAVSIICIGNGTASRETEEFTAELIGELKDLKLSYIIVNEAGASVYSASDVAVREFPDLDVSSRSAVSIARRLQDPLAELVKIEPQSIGVGQYQHDISPKVLSQRLSTVVESVVNYVGVDLNTASVELLAYVAGINNSVAKNIVEYRTDIGRFNNRQELLKVKRLGAKTFEQCAGFLRIGSGDNPLDNTAIHPESYHIAQKVLEICQIDLNEMGGEIDGKLREFNIDEMAQNIDAGIPTLKDVIANLKKPGRDPREDLPLPVFRKDVLNIKDLKVDMELKGTVLNVVDFGAFVDIGLEQSGLVHISELAERFVHHPLDVVSVGDIVNVRVLAIDEDKGRISLSMKGD
ncbi:MAG TPA: Tex family protein, partial [Syntrophomonadaceae bacterium]|nr:Tex family protein [Syntrophomonadaceae bacterium]